MIAVVFLGGYGILPYPHTPLMIAIAFLGGYGILPYPRTPLTLYLILWAREYVTMAAWVWQDAIPSYGCE
ncbi:hypothetical protein [Leyella stercorea]|uniref:hypothetical protein n=1 Tax=Leyella stercorea TaxID=363265 RepID=UPI003AB82174